MISRFIDVIREKYESMSPFQRRQELLKRYPKELLDDKQSFFHIYHDIVCVTITGEGDLVDIEYVPNDRY